MKRKEHCKWSIFGQREWGTETNTTPLSRIHKKPSVSSIVFSRLAIVLTILFWALYVLSVVVRQFIDGETSYHFTLEAFGYLVIVSFLIFSALVYLIARQGALQRFNKYVRVSRAVIENFFYKQQPSVTVLIPSYGEEVDVVRKTMLSAALQEYPDLKVVLLIDDDASKASPEEMLRLEATRCLAVEIQELLLVPSERFRAAIVDFEKTHSKNAKVKLQTIVTLIEHYNWAAKWLRAVAKKEVVEDHVDVFFADHVLCELADDLQLAEKALRDAHKEGVRFSYKEVSQFYQRLSSLFNARLETFERKQYISLSQEANKAMNLNSYMGLMGGMYKEQKISGGIALAKTHKQDKADLIIEDSDFILTLDADSILLREYCLRLVYFMQMTDNEDVAVTQTPYSSFRGAATRLERLSGATTDIQHIIHQGMTHYNATFWVGANAVLRKCALEDIVEKETIGGFEIKRYVQDRTVIEDTESSIDIAMHGWRLVNYPERLSYSATPPDFGSLVIQRRRWANGGLLILPKLLKLFRERRRSGKPSSKIEFMLRLNYMASIAWSNIGLIFLLVYPYDGRLLSPLILLAALPFFTAMSVDLKYCGYRYSDIIRIYGFNLILLPVNIAGTIKSLQQALTVKKTPFARTPKVKNRTATALPYVLAPIFIVAFSIFTLWRNIHGENWGNAAFAGLNTFAAIWAIISYIGIKNLFVDIVIGCVDLLYVNVPNSRKSRETLDADDTSDWQSVLYHGEASKKL